MTMTENNFFCRFIFVNNKWECSKCGTIIEIADNDPNPPLWPCFSPLKSTTNIPSSIKEFMENKLDPNDTADESTINYRYSLCSSCEYFQNNSCDKCGCAITRDRNYINKLASKSEECPIFKW